MSLITDDVDIRDVRLTMKHEDNGDYYLHLFEVGKKLYNREGQLVPTNIDLFLRISMSGGIAPFQVREAFVHLHRMLEKYKLNEDPRDELIEEQK